MVQPKHLLDDERAVSPVIGVILMVAITVILAAIIGTAVMSIGDDVNTDRPSVNIKATGSAGNAWTLTHTGGDVINKDLSVRYTTSTGSVDETWPADIRAGDEHTTNQSVVSDSTIRVVWTSDSGGQEYVLHETQVP